MHLIQIVSDGDNGTGSTWDGRKILKKNYPSFSVSIAIRKKISFT